MRSDLRTIRPAWTMLIVVLALTAANLAFNLAAQAAGASFPYTSFLADPTDRFGDFFSLLASYPGGDAAVVTDRSGLHAIMLLDLPSHRLLPWARIHGVTHFHMTPLSTVVALGLLRAVIAGIDPVLLFLSLNAALAIGWCRIAASIGGGRSQRLMWAALGLLCYPALLVFTRGNIFAGLTALLLIASMTLGLRRTSPIWAAILLALACNIRPNAILFAGPLLLFHWRAKWRVGIALGLAGLSILAATMLAAHLLYPAYGPATFLRGLHDYYAVYAIGAWGLAYGSSLFGALKLVLGYRTGLDGGALLVSLAIAATGMLAFRRRRVDEPTLLFLVASAYALGSTVLADYHLAIFLLPPMAIALRPAGSPETIARHRIMLIASALMLAPKNYLFSGLFSTQVLLNPLILLGTAATILTAALSPSPSRNAPLPQPA